MTSPVSAVEKPDRIWAYGQSRSLRVWTPIKPVIAGAHDEQEYVRADIHDAVARKAEALERALTDVLEAKALSGIRGLVAGWNGERLPEEKRCGRHPDELGVKLPTNCGAIYALDAAMVRARALLGGEHAGN